MPPLASEREATGRKSMQAVQGYHLQLVVPQLRDKPAG
jgi:hypothetical protein